MIRFVGGEQHNRLIDLPRWAVVEFPSNPAPGRRYGRGQTRLIKERYVLTQLRLTTGAIFYEYHLTTNQPNDTRPKKDREEDQNPAQ